MRLGTELFVTVFIVLLCSFFPCFGRNPRYMSSTLGVSKPPPQSSNGKNSSSGQNFNSSSTHNSNSSSTHNSSSSSANSSSSSSTPNSNSSSASDSNPSSAHNSNPSSANNSNSSSTHSSNSSSAHSSNSSFTHNSNSSSTQNAGQLVLNVDDFGAKADVNNTDNFQAFKNAWDRACCSSRPAKILVPERKTYYIRHINFTGPCRSSISMEIRGTIKAFTEMYTFPHRLWIKFENVTNLEIFGGGTVNGNGVLWWANSCKIKNTQPCQTESAPTALTFDNCTNLKVSDLKTMNAQQMHVHFQDCNRVEASNLMVVAPESSPNTDGLHFTRTSNVNVHDCVIGTGDDCVSIVNGTTNVQLSNITCGPGHGISIGSLGEDNSTSYVSNIYVKGVMLTGTMYGVRIKTWPGGSGYAENIVFENIKMKNVSNPIIIDQNYCDGNENCQTLKTGVQVENIIYRDISGTSATNAAITFDCDRSFPCRNIVLENVELSGLTAGAKVHAVCKNLNQTSQLNSTPGC